MYHKLPGDIPPAPPRTDQERKYYDYGKEYGFKKGLIEGQEIQINEKDILYKEVAKEGLSFSIIIVLSLIIGYVSGMITEKRRRFNKEMLQKLSGIQEW